MNKEKLEDLFIELINISNQDDGDYKFNGNYGSITKIRKKGNILVFYGLSEDYRLEGLEIRVGSIRTKNLFNDYQIIKELNKNKD